MKRGDWWKVTEVLIFLKKFDSESLNEFRTLYRYLQENSKLEISNKRRIRSRKERIL